MSFAAFAAQHGLIVRDVVADGQVHRVPTELHPRKKNGAYAYDGEKGFVQAWDMHPEAIPYRDARPSTAPRIRVPSPQTDRKDAQRLAAAIVARSSLQPHPYLARKGFPSQAGLVDEGSLIVPMFDAAKYALVGVQRIAEDGAKKFLRGMAAKDAVHHIGRGGRDILVEGFATGLSVRAALESMYARARVVVCFSAGNLAAVAKRYRGIVIADHDASGAGEAAARNSGLPWAMPAEVGMDANDVHQRDGLPAVCRLIRETGG